MVKYQEICIRFKENEMNDINIVLVEPEIPENTGNIARTCAVTGAALHLVKPLGFCTESSRLKRAGLDYWNKLDIFYYENLDEFLAEHGNDELYFFSSKGKRTHASVKYGKGCYLVFGKETAGLPEWLLKQYPDSCLRIPMRNTLRCLNLSNSVAVGVYEVLRQSDFYGLETSGEPTTFLWED